jgi:CheY-like chemotaxis protein
MKPLSIVVADDVEEIQTLVRQWLDDVGHLVTCVSSGGEATKLLKRQHFDLVITDVLMPDGDGLDVIRELRRTPDTRVLAISGGGRHMQAIDCLNVAKGMGAHAVLFKPFSRQQLLRAVETACPDRP